MRHIGGEARSGDELLEAQNRQRRWIRYALKSRRDLHQIVLSTRKKLNLVSAGKDPILDGSCTRSEIANYLVMIEDAEAAQVAHHEQLGDDHARCPRLNDKFMCDAKQEPGGHDV